MSIRQRLTLIVLVVAIPLLLLSAFIVWWLADRESEKRRDAMLYASRAVLTAVDAQLDKYITVAQMLATSPSLQRDDLAAFREEAERAVPVISRYGVVLADARGQQVVNTLVSAAEPLPPVPPKVLPNEIRAFQAKQFQISNVISGPVTKIPVIVVGVPVFQAGKPAYYLMIGVDVTIFRDLLHGQHVPAGWLPAMIDRQGNFIVRSHDPDRFVGKPASAGWRAVMQREGVFEYPWAEGQMTHANTVSPLSGWAVGISAHNDVFAAPIRQTVLIASLVGLAVTLSSMLLAAWAARRITTPIKALETGAQTLQRGEPVSFAATGVPEFDQALQAFGTASKALLDHEDQHARAEEALRRQASLLNLAHDAIIVLSMEDAITFWSRGAEETYGWTTEEATGRAIHDLLRTRFPKPLAEISADVAETGRWDGELTHTRKDGREIVVASRWALQRDRSGRPAGILEINRDITEHKLAEQQSAALTSRLRATVDTAVDAIIVIDENGIVQSVNPAVERIFGFQANEVVGKSVNLLIPEPHRSAHDGYIGAYVRTGVGKIIGIGRETEAQRKDGKIFPVDLAVAEWHMAGKRFFTGIMRDITARRRAEEHIQFVMRELSHRTKNLLAVVQAMAWKTARTSVDLEDFGKHFASRVAALACSHDLLTRTEWKGVRLEDLVRGQLDLFGAEKYLDAHGPDLVLKPESAQSLGLALHELATNASKYGALTHPAGRIEIGWSVDLQDAGSGQFRMCWRETGGPKVTAPRRKGFGHTVIKDLTERALKGEVAVEFAAEGLIWQFTAPAITALVSPPIVAN